MFYYTVRVIVQVLTNYDKVKSLHCIIVTFRFTIVLTYDIVNSLLLSLKSPFQRVSLKFVLYCKVLLQFASMSLKKYDKCKNSRQVLQ